MAHIYKIESDRYEKLEPQVMDVPKMGEIENIGMHVLPIFKQEVSGITVMMTRVDVNGYIAPHNAPKPVVIQLVEGSFRVSVLRNDGSEAFGLEAVAGDMLIYSVPMNLHSYNAGNEGATYIAVSTQ